MSLLLFIALSAEYIGCVGHGPWRPCKFEATNVSYESSPRARRRSHVERHDGAKPDRVSRENEARHDILLFSNSILTAGHETEVAAPEPANVTRAATEDSRGLISTASLWTARPGFTGSLPLFVIPATLSE
jgi:hypothetical protein